MFEESLYKEQEKVESLEKEVETTKTAHHELEEKYADVSSAIVPHFFRSSTFTVGFQLIRLNFSLLKPEVGCRYCRLGSPHVKFIINKTYYLLTATQYSGSNISATKILKI